MEPLKEEPFFLSWYWEYVPKRVAYCPVLLHSTVVGSSSRMQGALSAPQRAYPTMRGCMLQQSTHHKDGAQWNHSLARPQPSPYSNLAGFYVLGLDKWDRLLHTMSLEPPTETTDRHHHDELQYSSSSSNVHSTCTYCR